MTNFIVKNLTFSYPGQKPLFTDFSFSAKAGDIVYIKGKNGAGKTTLLNIFCGVIPKYITGRFRGEIFINDIDISQKKIPEIAQYIGLLMQDAEKQLLFPDVESELAFSLENFCLPRHKIELKIKNTMELFNISHLRFSKTYMLSYGEKKIVELASIFAQNPHLFLLDEPFSGLSEKYKKVLKNAIKTYSEYEKIFILTGHSQIYNELANKPIEL